ncbi:hypothetical protein PG994_002061 [Apiospora phragmitis]|uniref:Zn(2)-C6 fungal-type domain-containing protein n=1 Tax=Apiospora phragmitis TaxID=2905665 RepID=A0ABR1WVC9_9PEZI
MAFNGQNSYNFENMSSGNMNSDNINSENNFENIDFGNMDYTNQTFGFNPNPMSSGIQNTNTGNMDFSLPNNMSSMFNNTGFNHAGFNHNGFNYNGFNHTGNMPNGFQPIYHMGSQYPQPSQLMGAQYPNVLNPHIMAVPAGNGYSDPSVMSNNSFDPTLPSMDQGLGSAAPMPIFNVDNATNYMSNSQDTMQGPSQHNVDQNPVIFKELDVTQNGKFPDVPSPPLPVPRKKATARSSKAKNRTNTQVITPPPSAATASASAPAPAPATPSPVPAPAPAGPAKRGRKRKASKDHEAEATGQGRATKRLKQFSCTECRKSKVKCDAGPGKPCSKCTKDGKKCVVDNQDHRTKATNFEELVEKLERKHLLAMECLCLIWRATGTEAHFELFKNFWTGASTATTGLACLVAIKAQIFGTDDMLPTWSENCSSVSFDNIVAELKSILEQKVKVKDLRPLKNHLKKVAHWVLAAAYHKLDELSQQNAKDVVDMDHQTNPFVQWLSIDLKQGQISDEADATNKEFLRQRGELKPTYLKGLYLKEHREWHKKVECCNLARQLLTPPPSPKSAVSANFDSAVSTSSESAVFSVSLVPAAEDNYVRPQEPQPTVPPFKEHQHIYIGQSYAPTTDSVDQSPNQVGDAQNDAEAAGLALLQASSAEGYGQPASPAIDPALLSAGVEQSLPDINDDRMDIDDDVNNQGSGPHNPAPESSFNSGSGASPGPAVYTVDDLMADLTTALQDPEELAAPEAGQPTDGEFHDILMTDDFQELSSSEFDQLIEKKFETSGASSEPSSPAEGPTEAGNPSDSRFGDFAESCDDGEQSSEDNESDNESVNDEFQAVWEADRGGEEHGTKP